MNSTKPHEELKFSCPGCGQHLACEASCAGTVIRCPACALDFAVPSLAPTAQPPAEPCEPPAPPIERACPSCGIALPADAVLCVQCGYNFTRSKVISTYLSALRGAFALLLRRLFWVAAVAAVVIGALVLRSGPKPPPPPPPSPSVLKAVSGGAGFYDFVVAFHPHLLNFAARKSVEGRANVSDADKVMARRAYSNLSACIFCTHSVSMIRRLQIISVYDSATRRNRAFDTKSLSAVADWLELHVRDMQRVGNLTPGELAYLRVPCDEAIAIARGKGAGASMSERARRRAVVAWLEQEQERVKLWIQAYLAKPDASRPAPGSGRVSP